MVEIETISQRKGCSLDAGIFVLLPNRTKVNELKLTLAVEDTFSVLL